MAIYKNTSHQDLAIPGVGIVKAGATVDLPPEFHNVHFIRVKPLKPEREKTGDDDQLKIKTT